MGDGAGATKLGGLWLSALNVQYRDFNHAITLLSALLSVARWPSEIMVEWLLWLYALNR